jgi:hypothetical protein
MWRQHGLLRFARNDEADFGPQKRRDADMIEAAEDHFEWLLQVMSQRFQSCHCALPISF